jgi:UDP-N-acetylmuramate: L-alanyl-gamma-D-glutamyl-meso-diaminopimelate ligase
VRNALAAIAVGSAVGLTAIALREGLKTFAGVKRRLELRGSERGVRVYDDFAHHPTAIAETLGALRMAHPASRLWAVFEPRSATSCLKVFEHDFVEAFAFADETILAAVFRSSIAGDRRLDPQAVVAELQARGRRARYVPTTDGIVDLISREARAGDLVVLMSNGGFDNIHEKLLARIKGDEMGDEQRATSDERR